jgi:hypothetical protein
MACDNLDSLVYDSLDSDVKSLCNDDTTIQNNIYKLYNGIENAGKLIINNGNSITSSNLPAYITDAGILKKFTDLDQYNNILSENGCPSESNLMRLTGDDDLNYSDFIEGTNIVDNQSCENINKIVYSVLDNNSTIDDVKNTLGKVGYIDPDLQMNIINNNIVTKKNEYVKPDEPTSELEPTSLTNCEGTCVLNDIKEECNTDTNCVGLLVGPEPAATDDDSVVQQYSKINYLGSNLQNQEIVEGEVNNLINYDIYNREIEVKLTDLPDSCLGISETPIQENTKIFSNYNQKIPSNISCGYNPFLNQTYNERSNSIQELNTETSNFNSSLNSISATNNETLEEIKNNTGTIGQNIDSSINNMNEQEKYIKTTKTNKIIPNRLKDFIVLKNQNKAEIILIGIIGLLLVGTISGGILKIKKKI